MKAADKNDNENAMTKDLKRNSAEKAVRYVVENKRHSMNDVVLQHIGGDTSFFQAVHYEFKVETRAEDMFNCKRNIMINLKSIWKIMILQKVKKGNSNLLFYSNKKNLFINCV